MIDHVRTFLLRVVVGGLVLVGFTAAPAGADPSGPSDFRSEVTGIVPAVEGVTAEIRGGDTFLELSVADGHTVIVEGYLGEPYLRFNPNGTIERNRLSPATYLNEDRRGQVAIPPDAQEADATTPPDWVQIATGGTYAWHDHRVHWMSDASPRVGRGERVGGAYDPWRVPIVVDGAPAEVQGTLTYEAAVSPIPWIVLALGAGVGLAWFGRRGGLRVAAVAMVVVSATAVFVGRAEWSSTPQGGGNPLLWILPLIALVTAGAAIPLAKRSAGVVLTLASVASLSGWALFRVQSLLKPVLPTEIPAGADRAIIALALGISAAAAYLAVTSGALSLPSLDDDEPERSAEA